jgi:hypothetical protein
VPRHCTVCGCDDQARIDRAIVERVPLRTISRQFAVSKDAVQRHAQNHLPELLIQAQAAREMVQAEALLEQLNVIQAAVFRTMREAESDQEWSLLLRAAKEARETTMTMAKINQAAVETDRYRREFEALVSEVERLSNANGSARAPLTGH